MNINGTVSIKKIDKVKGTLNINAATTLTDDLKIEDSGSVSIGTSGSLSGDKIEVKDSGSLVVAGVLNLSDELKVKDDATLTVTPSGSGTLDEKLKLEDDAEFTNSGNLTIEDVEVKDDASFTNNAGGFIRITNDLKVEDDSTLTNSGTITVEDDIEFKDDATINLNGVLNLCDDDGTEGDNDFDVGEDVILIGSGTACLCTSNNDNNYNNNSSNQGAITYNQSCNGPLPIELISFEAVREEFDVILQWETLSEINNDKFIVQFSVDGKSFENIGEVQGAGTSHEKKLYVFRDFRPQSDRFMYYRLVNQDFDGRKGFSDILSLENRQSQTKSLGPIKVYPTVCSRGGEISVLGIDEQKNLECYLISLSGAHYELEIKNGHTTIPDNVPYGIHLLKILVESQSFNVRVVVTQ